MSPTDFLERWPRFVRRWALHFETEIESAVGQFASGLAAESRVLDAGAGEGRYKRYFHRQRYLGVDLAIGDQSWNYNSLHAIADLNALPFGDSAFDAALNIVTLEHLTDPQAALDEIIRVLRPGARLLLVAPMEWEEHQQPVDFFRYTRYGLQLLLSRAGFDEIRIEPVGGFFRLLSRRLLNTLQFFMRGTRWLIFVPAALLLVPLALLVPVLEPFDDTRHFTLGFVAWARKPLGRRAAPLVAS